MFLDARYIVTESFLIEQIAFSAFARGVSNHASSTTHESEGLVACLLKMAEHHHATEVTNVERVGCGVDAHIGRHHFFFKKFVGAWHHLVEHATPFEFFYKIHRCIFAFF